MRRTYNVKSTVRGESTIRDAYGFEVPQNLAALYVEHSATWSAEEKRRTDKWLQFLKDICPLDHQKRNLIFAGFWDSILEERLKDIITEHKKHPEGTDDGYRLEGLVRMGIPSFLRGNLWGLFLGYDSEKPPGLFKLLSTQADKSHSLKANPNSDDALQKTHFRNQSSSSRELESLDETSAFTEHPIFYCEQTIEQINKDLDRTFPGHPLMDSSGKEALREILVAYSMHRPDIGYCQGMNFISGLLLLFHQPEDAFWNLSSIIENLLPNQFDRDMLPAVIDKLVFRHLVEEEFPHLAKHLDTLNVDVSYLCPHWFLCCFVNALPMETCLRVWDILFWERKPNVLFKVALALVDFYSEDLMEIHCTAAAWERLQIMAASFFNSTQLIETAWEKFENVDEIQISELRALYLDRIKEQSIKDLMGKGTPFGTLDVSTENTPTKILASSASLVRDEASFTSSSESLAVPRSLQDSVYQLRNAENQRVAKDVLSVIRETEGLPEELSLTIHELVGRLIDTESAGRDAQSRLDYSRKEITKSNEMNRSLKTRLGAVYTELDKKNECLDRMIAKCQILTEKVAAQEEMICRQRRLMFNRMSTSPRGNTEATKSSKGQDRGTQSLKNLFSFRK